MSGLVLDGDSGQGLPGVTVLVLGTTLGTATNAEGFTLPDVPATTTQLQFRCVGYRAREAALGAGAGAGGPLRVTLAAENQALDEVVVTGLATNIKRANLANNVAPVSAQELVGQTRAATLDGALQGKLSGAVIYEPRRRAGRRGFGAATRAFLDYRLVGAALCY